MKTNLDGATVIITGGSKGYGTGIAEVLKEKGCRIWITGRDGSALDDTAGRLGVNACRADVTSPADWDSIFDEVIGKTGRLDVLVNNAGAGIRIAPLAEMTDDEIVQSISVNLTGTALGCRRAAIVMSKQNSGTIVNVSSVCQQQAWPGFSVYSAAKAGIRQLSNCLYTELRKSGVRVTTIVPSWGATGFAKSAGLPDKPEDIRAKCTQPRELGEIVAQICELPPHLAIQDMTLWPMVQEVIPL